VQQSARTFEQTIPTISYEFYLHVPIVGSVDVINMSKIVVRVISPIRDDKSLALYTTV
jgi:hypothetical protein